MERSALQNVGKHLWSGDEESGKQLHIVWGGIDSSDPNSASNEPSSDSTEKAKHSQRPDGVSFLDWSSSKSHSSKSHLSTPEDDRLPSDVPTGLPSDLPSDLPSVGSALHATNNCKPCFFTRNGLQTCTKGYSCNWCHLPHEWQGVRRPCKSKRDRYKKHLAEHADAIRMNKEGASKPKQIVNL